MRLPRISTRSMVRVSQKKPSRGFPKDYVQGGTPTDKVIAEMTEWVNHPLECGQFLTNVAKLDGGDSYGACCRC